MKRFHVHIAVDDLNANIRFYSRLFGAQPNIVKDDYAKWMLEDPRINFAISNRSGHRGLDHLGMQFEDEAGLAAAREHFLVADADTSTRENTTSCCYAVSNKHWVVDPQGIAWEAFHTLEQIPTFNDRSTRSKIPATIPVASQPNHCGPASSCC